MALTQIDHVEGTIADCIDNCFNAAQACEWCADECVQMGDEEMARCIQLCRDAADLTTDHARFMVRQSSYSSDLAETCADVSVTVRRRAARWHQPEPPESDRPRVHSRVPIFPYGGPDTADYGG